MRKVFRIVEIRKPKKAKSGNWFVDCVTARSVVVTVWGFDRVTKVTEATLPFQLCCDCKIPNSGVIEHLGQNFWATERYKFTIQENTSIK
jgi:hypothetical protein